MENNKESDTPLSPEVETIMHQNDLFTYTGHRYSGIKEQATGRPVRNVQEQGQTKPNDNNNHSIFMTVEKHRRRNVKETLQLVSNAITDTRGRNVVAQVPFDIDDYCVSIVKAASDIAGWEAIFDNKTNKFYLTYKEEDKTKDKTKDKKKDKKK